MLEAGRAGYGSLIGYVRATFLVALTDAAGVGTGLAIMGVPLALPLASLVFLGAFIPLIGALIAGFLAVVVALLAKGIVYALLTLGLLIVIAQTRSAFAAAAGDGPRGRDSPARGGAGHLHRRRARGDRRRLAGRTDGRVLQQRDTGAARQRSGRRTRPAGRGCAGLWRDPRRLG